MTLYKTRGLTLAIKDAFEEITLGLMEDALKKDRKGHHDNRGGGTAP